MPTNKPEQLPDIPIARIDEEIARTQAEAIDVELRLEILRNQMQLLQRIRSSAYREIEGEPVSHLDSGEDVLLAPLRPKQAIRQLLKAKPNLKTGEVISRLRSRIHTRSKDIPKSIYAALSQLRKMGQVDRDETGRWSLVTQEPPK